MAELVLVTGAAGAIGRAVCPQLRAAGYRVRGFDRQQSGHADETVVGDLTDAQAVADALAGCDAVVHFGATPDVADFASELLPNNILGSYHLLEAASEHRPRVLVLASTLRVIAGVRQRTGPITRADGVAPQELYSVSKCCMEVMAEFYARRKNLAITCMRIGWFLRNNAECARLRQLDASHSYLSHDDCARFVLAALTCPTPPPFALLFAVSADGGERYDLAAADAAIGYRPQDRFPAGTPAAIVAC